MDYRLRGCGSDRNEGLQLDVDENYDDDDDDDDLSDTNCDVSTPVGYGSPHRTKTGHSDKSNRNQIRSRRWFSVPNEGVMGR